jgi:hypothetical protein
LLVFTSGLRNVGQSFTALALPRLDGLKWTYLISHIFLTFTSPVMLYSVIWYEKNSADLRSR